MQPLLLYSVQIAEQPAHGHISADDSLAHVGSVAVRSIRQHIAVGPHVVAQLIKCILAQLPSGRRSWL